MLVNSSVEGVWRQILERVPEPRLLIDAGCQIRYANAEAARTLKTSTGALLRLDLRRLLAPGGGSIPGNCERYMAATETDPSLGPVSVHMRRCDGTSFPCEMTLVRVDLASGAHGLVLFRDETGQRKEALELALRRVQTRNARELARLKDHFLSVISHEIKTPLSVIIGNTELLQDRHPEESSLDDISRAAMDVARRIDAILDYSALVSGSLPLYRSDIVLDEIVSAAVDITLDHFDAKGMRLEPALARPGPVVTGDSRRLMQAVMALLENAAKFGRTGDRAGIRTSHDGPMARVEVWDTGPGMSRRQREYALAPFGGGPRSLSDPICGIGLGLPIARLLVELHGGQVWIDSHEGKGTSVVLSLPCSRT